MLPADGGDCDTVLAQFAGAGIDVAALAQKLQTDGADSFVEAWQQLLGVINNQVAKVNP
jgi:transaldolase